MYNHGRYRGSGELSQKPGRTQGAPGTISYTGKEIAKLFELTDFFAIAEPHY